ncbi:DUF4199 domain-containing protein [Aquimarina algiphila]|nr:DUF4199 domain-containing protein [Aquimarina algiphila]
MEEVNISSKKYILTYGIILGIVSIIYNSILYITDNMMNINLIEGGIDLAILICVITYGIYSYKTANKGFLELSKAIKIGIGIAIIGALTLIIWIVLLMNVIEPEMINQIAEVQYKEMISNNPDISQEEIDENIVSIKTINSSYVKSAMSLVSNLLFGFLIALMGGAIMQKKRDIY